MRRPGGSRGAFAALATALAMALSEGVAAADPDSVFVESVRGNLGATAVALGDFGGDSRPDYAVA